MIENNLVNRLVSSFPRIACRQMKRQALIFVILQDRFEECFELNRKSRVRQVWNAAYMQFAWLLQAYEAEDVLQLMRGLAS